MFNIDREIKEDYLESKPTGTANSNKFVLKKVDDYESKENKAVYMMSHGEIREMISIIFRNSSENDILKNASIIRKYIDFCIEKNIVPHMENRLATFNRKEARKFVSKNALDYKYITPEEKLEYMNLLKNDQDKALIEAFYVGIRGRTVIGGTLEEIINLQIDENSSEFKNNFITLVRNNGESRTIWISDFTKDILLKAKNQEFYTSNNGVETEAIRGGIRNLQINKVDNYVFRIPIKTKFETFNSILVNSRMQRIQQWVGNEYLTVHSLYMSGMITKALDIIKEKGEISIVDYDNICEQYGYRTGDDSRWMVLKDIVSYYIKLTKLKN